MINGHVERLSVERDDSVLRDRLVNPNGNRTLWYVSFWPADLAEDLVSEAMRREFGYANYQGVFYAEDKNYDSALVITLKHGFKYFNKLDLRPYSTRSPNGTLLTVIDYPPRDSDDFTKSSVVDCLTGKCVLENVYISQSDFFFSVPKGQIEYVVLEGEYSVDKELDITDRF